MKISHVIYKVSDLHQAVKEFRTKGRALRCRCLFPDELGIHSMMTYFTIDPKPKNFVHPNGVVRIGDVFFGTKAEYIPLIQELCDDDYLHLFVNEKPGDDIRFEFQMADPSKKPCINTEPDAKLYIR